MTYQIVLAIAALLWGTFFLGYLSGKVGILKNRLLNLYLLVFLFFYFEKGLGFYAELQRMFSSMNNISPLFLEVLSLLSEVIIYAGIIFIIRYISGSKILKHIIVLLILYVLPWSLSFLDSLLSIRSYLELPFWGYMIVLSIVLYKRNPNQKRFLSLLLGSLGSMALITLIDGILEALIGLDIPKDPIIVLCLSTLGFFLAGGFKMKETIEVDTMTDPFAEKYGITPREREISGYLVKGWSYQSIADKLFISLATVKTHVHRLYVKTKVNSRFKLLEMIRSEK